GHPVDLPGLAAVIGIGLFEVGCAGVGFAPEKADIHQLAVVGVLPVELALPVLELTDLRDGIDRAVLAVGPVDGPLVGLSVVETDCQALDDSAGAVQHDFLDVARPVPYLVRLYSAVELNPFLRAGQSMLELRQMDL